jgi:hypothetical protein
MIVVDPFQELDACDHPLFVDRVDFNSPSNSLDQHDGQAPAQVFAELV